MPQRTLSEAEFNAIKQKVLSEAPQNLSEQDFYRWAQPRMAAAVGAAENLPAQPEGSALGRFAAGVWEMVNPVSLVTGVAQAARHPIDTGTAIVGAMGNELGKARDLYREGRYVEAAGHGLAGVLPVVGPAAAETGEQIASGDVAGGLGKMTGLVAPVAVAPAVKAGMRSVPRVAGPTAKALEGGAAEMVADVASPKVGGQVKLRMGNQARELTPELLKRGEAGAWTRGGLHANVQEGLARAEEALDAAADARNAGKPIVTKPIIDALKAEREKLVAKATGADKPVPVQKPVKGSFFETETVGEPAGKDVVPGPNKGRVAEIDRAIKEVESLGEQAHYEAIRRIRQAYDGPAKAIYSPAVTADYLTAQGSKLGAADVTGALRKALAAEDPATAAANADYHLYRTMDDVIQAAKETEAQRPRIGRRMMATLFGMGAHGASGGALMLAAEMAFEGGLAPKLKVAQLMADAAKAMRAGSEARVQSIASQLRAFAKNKGAKMGAVQVGRATSPSGPQTQPEPAR